MPHSRDILLQKEPKGKVRKWGEWGMAMKYTFILRSAAASLAVALVLKKKEEAKAWQADKKNRNFIAKTKKLS